MSYDQLDIASADLLKSLDDKLDLERNAAEYIIAWQSMQKAPSEVIYTSLFSIADAIIKEKEEGEDKFEYEYDTGTDTGAGLLLNTQDTQDDLTNHIWVDGLQRGKKTLTTTPYGLCTDQQQVIHTKNITSHSTLPITRFFVCIL